MIEWPVVVSAASLAVGMPIGVGLWSWWLKRRKAQRRLSLPLPGLWPVKSREIFSGSEQEVWHLLKVVFHDHAVMVKVPILRFTHLRDSPFQTASSRAVSLKNEQYMREQWLELLGSLYATFTVCTPGGRVVGCVDVAGRHDASKASRNFKEALLLDCGIAYAVTTGASLQEAGKLRELFLGESPLPPVDEQATRGGDSDFHAEMAAFARQQGKLVS